MLPAIIGAIGGIASTGLQFLGNKALAEEQNKQNIEMWQRKNEYDAPVAQVQRLRDAGLNPALAYGKGSVANLSGSAPGMTRAEAPNVADSIAAVQQVDNLSQQNKLLSVQIEKAEYEKDNERIERDKNQHDFDLYKDLPIPSNASWPALAGSGVFDKAAAYAQSEGVDDLVRLGILVPKDKEAYMRYLEQKNAPALPR